tara:strand:- start:301 stop:531 length:231 start_codon:yes stop_codon:yes gene_type:complete
MKDVSYAKIIRVRLSQGNLVGRSKDAILEELVSVKGLGSYGHNHIAMWLGKNDKISIDSEVCRCMCLLVRSEKKLY